jgi:hypothetical protein
MRKFILIFATMVSSAALFAQTPATTATPVKPMKGAMAPSVTPPSAVSSAFSGAYASASNVRWMQTPDGMYAAEFINSSVKTKAVYTSAGVLDRTRMSIATSAIPSAVNTAAASSLNGQTIQKAFQITMAKTKDVFYNLRFNNEDHYFTAAGAVAKWDKTNDKPVTE